MSDENPCFTTQRLSASEPIATRLRRRTHDWFSHALYAWCFLRAYIAVNRARHLLTCGGIKKAGESLLRPWKRLPASRLRSRATIEQVERAIVDACKWQVRETNCFPRAIAAYSLLQSIGAQPVLHIGVRAMPFAGHAWVEVQGTAIADTLTSIERATLSVLVVVPPVTPIFHQ